MSPFCSCCFTFDVPICFRHDRRMNERNPRALADAVARRRVDLGINTQRELAEIADLSPRMVGEIENARRASYRDTTFIKLDNALQWEPGSALRVFLTGLAPVARMTDTQLQGGDSDQEVIYSAEAVQISYGDGYATATVSIATDDDLATYSKADLLGVAYETRIRFTDAMNRLRRVAEETRRMQGTSIRHETAPAASAASPDPAVAYDDIAQAKLAEALQSDYMPAASPHTQPDPHNDVGE